MRICQVRYMSLALRRIILARGKVLRNLYIYKVFKATGEKKNYLEEFRKRDKN